MNVKCPCCDRDIELYDNDNIFTCCDKDWKVIFLEYKNNNNNKSSLICYNLKLESMVDVV